MEKLKSNHLSHLAKQISRAWCLDLEQLNLYDLIDTNYHIAARTLSVNMTETQFVGRVHSSKTLTGLDDDAHSTGSEGAETAVNVDIVCAEGGNDVTAAAGSVQMHSVSLDDSDKATTAGQVDTNASKTLNATDE